MEEPFVIAVPSPPDVLSLRDHEKPPNALPPLEIHRALDESVGSFVRLRLWNIGTGPAIVERINLGRPGETECLDQLPGGFQPIGAGQAADLEIASPAWPATLGDDTLTIAYTHANGRGYKTRSDVTIGDPIVSCMMYARSRA
jgi:hypothetical protein